MSSTVLFDLDGTLADNSHRQHFLLGDKKDWDAFFDAQERDVPNDPIVALYKALFASERFSVLVVTARPERYRKNTEKWFANHEIPLGRMLMRVDGDRRSDEVIKREMLVELKQEGSLPLFVVDDRSGVVDMWRREGITCLQCADHNF